ncbi:MAG: hypothetical protein A2X36_04735 [Elusimicrobia bacterium GWA2_69_24]|nr:MAG: hypothetical protein A2X36_04735 [Elusimicrobia bacterium GWA2_69_24]
MKEIEIEGKTVTIAVEAGLEKLGMARSEVEVVVIDEGSAGFLGIGMKPAKVRIRPKHWSADGTAAAPAPATPPPQREERRRPRPASERPPRRESRPSSGDAHSRPPRSAAPERRGRAPEPRPQRAPAPEPRPSSGEAHDRLPRTASPESRPAPAPRKELREIELTDAERANACAVTETVLKEIFQLAGLAQSRIKTSWDPRQSRVLAEVETEDAGLLIGKGGKTLESLQFLTTVIVGRKTGKPTAIQVETENYWKRIEEKLLSEAERAAEEVKRTGAPFRFEPMEPALRRLIHRRLAGNPDVETASEGEGPWRKVVLKPRSGG